MRSLRGTVALSAAFVAALMLLAVTFLFGGAHNNASPAAEASGGDFQLDFVASAPFTYNHATGGGAYDDRTIGTNNDVVESLEAGDFQCGEIVSYLVQIRVDAEAAGSQTIELSHEFLANTTGQPGAGHVDVVDVAVNYGAVSGGNGPGSTDSGISDDGGSAITNVVEAFDPAETVPFGSPPAEKLDLTYRVTDLEAGERVVVRIDVRLGCDPGSSPTGNLQANISSARVVAPTQDEINVGTQTIPFKQFGSLPHTATPTNTPTATATPVPTDTATSTPTLTATSTPVHTATSTPTSGVGPVRTSTRTATATARPPTSTPTRVSTAEAAEITPVPTGQTLPETGDGSGGASPRRATVAVLALGAAALTSLAFGLALSRRRRA